MKPKISLSMCIIFIQTSGSFKEQFHIQVAEFEDDHDIYPDYNNQVIISLLLFRSQENINVYI